jgi:sarcosine oxidase
VAGVLASARENQLPHRLLESSEMTRLYPQHRLDASEVVVLDEQAGFLRPERSVAAAASRAEALGARLLAETHVTSIDASDGGVVIETSRGRFAAERALVTAGPWTSKLLPRLGLPLQVERQMMAWMAVDDPASFAPQRFPIFIHEVAGGRFRYGFPCLDGRSIKLAVHHEGTDADPDSVNREVGDADLLPIRDFARDHLHGVTSEVVNATVCMYTNTRDDRFIAATPAGMPGVTVLSACSGHGFKFAAVMGELMAERILDARALPAIIRT